MDGVPLHDVPDDGLIAQGQERFRQRFVRVPDARSLSAAEDDRSHSLDHIPCCPLRGNHNFLSVADRCRGGLRFMLVVCETDFEPSREPIERHEYAANAVFQAPEDGDRFTPFSVDTAGKVRYTHGPSGGASKPRPSLLARVM